MKKKKKIKKIILIILSVLAVYTIFNTTNYLFVRTKAEIYLCTKYHASPEEFKYVDCKHSDISCDYWFFWAWLNVEDFTFNYKYNGKSVLVNRYNYKFYDDYQIHDLQKWCTDLLKENADENIIGMRINSHDIVSYLKDNHKSSRYIIQENEALDFMNYLFKNDKLCVAYHVDDIVSDSDKKSIKQNISNAVIEKLNLKIEKNKTIKVNVTEGNEMDLKLTDINGKDIYFDNIFMPVFVYVEKYETFYRTP